MTRRDPKSCEFVLSQRKANNENAIKPEPNIVYELMTARASRRQMNAGNVIFKNLKINGRLPAIPFFFFFIL